MNTINFFRFIRSKNSLLTVVIPASSYGHNGVRYLSDLLLSISIQKTPVRIVVSDHSRDYAIKRYLDDADKANVFYFRNRRGRGNWCHNANYAIRIARFGRSPLIKIMFQDDIFVDPEALEKIITAFNSEPDKGWLCHASSHFLDPGVPIDFNRKLALTETRKILVPKFTPRLLLLENDISCPSAITFKKNYKVEFDKNILWGGDCDFYWALSLHFGEPIILETNLTANREHNFSITHRFQTDNSPSKKRFIDGRKVRNSKDLLVWEIEYMDRKYKYRLPVIQTFPIRIVRLMRLIKYKFFVVS